MKANMCASPPQRTRQRAASSTLPRLTLMYTTYPFHLCISSASKPRPFSRLRRHSTAGTHQLDKGAGALSLVNRVCQQRGQAGGSVCCGWTTLPHLFLPSRLCLATPSSPRLPPPTPATAFPARCALRTTTAASPNIHPAPPFAHLLPAVVPLRHLRATDAINRTYGAMCGRNAAQRFPNRVTRILIGRRAERLVYGRAPYHLRPRRAAGAICYCDITNITDEETHTQNALVTSLRLLAPTRQ